MLWLRSLLILTVGRILAQEYSDTDSTLYDVIKSWAADQSTYRFLLWPVLNSATMDKGKSFTCIVIYCNLVTELCFAPCLSSKEKRKKKNRKTHAETISVGLADG